MTPTRTGPLLGLVVVLAALVYGLAAVAYTSLPRLPAYAPVTLVLLALAELALARVVRDRVTHRVRLGSRPMDPLQIARAAVLAKASSATGAVLLGGYAGLLAWTLPRRDELTLAADDALVAGASAVAALALVVAALLLERACRTPSVPEDPFR